MAETRPPFDFADLSRRLGEIKIPAIDWQGLLAAQQKNWEALGQANKVWFEGNQKVVQRQVEILQNALAEAAAASSDMLKEGDARAAAEKRLERAKTSFEQAMGNIRELFDAASRANQDALDVIQKRALEGFDEITSMLKPKR
jgi:phasin family protein